MTPFRWSIVEVRYLPQFFLWQFLMNALLDDVIQDFLHLGDIENGCLNSCWCVEFSHDFIALSGVTDHILCKHDIQHPKLNTFEIEFDMTKHDNVLPATITFFNVTRDCCIWSQPIISFGGCTVTPACWVSTIKKLVVFVLSPRKSFESVLAATRM